MCPQETHTCRVEGSLVGVVTKHGQAGQVGCERLGAVTHVCLVELGEPGQIFCGESGIAIQPGTGTQQVLSCLSLDSLGMDTRNPLRDLVVEAGVEVGVEHGDFDAVHVDHGKTPGSHGGRGPVCDL